MRLHTYSLDAALAALPGFPELRARRVLLRAPRAEDVAAVFALYSDPAVVRFRKRPPLATPREAITLLLECIDGFAARTRIDWMLARRSDDATMGTCALFAFDPARRAAEIGYALLPDFRGRGLAREAVARALDWAIADLGLECIDASIDPGNLASRRVLQGLGFRERDADEQAEWLCLASRDWRGS